MTRRGGGGGGGEEGKREIRKCAVVRIAEHGARRSVAAACVSESVCMNDHYFFRFPFFLRHSVIE